MLETARNLIFQNHSKMPATPFSRDARDVLAGA